MIDEAEEPVARKRNHLAVCDDGVTRVLID